MPHTTSAKKALRQDAKRRDRNKAVKKDLKVQFKKFAALLAEGTTEQKVAQRIICEKKLDKAAARKVIHRNLAARKKSQLAKALAPKKTA